MGLVDLTIKDYLTVLKTDAPAPGGGSVSALSGAQGIALVIMVAELTLGREKYAAFQEICENGKIQANRVLSALTDGIDRDTDAYNLVCDAIKMPKNSDDEKAARSRSICDATLMATLVPFETMEFGLEGLRIARSLVGRSNPNCSSDLGVAALNLLACIKGAWLNVLTNIPGIKDPEKEEDFRNKGKLLYDESIKLAESIYEDVAKNFI